MIMSISLLYIITYVDSKISLHNEKSVFTLYIFVFLSQPPVANNVELLLKSIVSTF